jgi:hypothetical protein
MNNNMNTADAMRQLTAESILNTYDDYVKQLYLNIRTCAENGQNSYKIPDDIARNLNLKYDKKSTCQIYEELKSLGYDIQINEIYKAGKFPPTYNIPKSYSILISWK